MKKLLSNKLVITMMVLALAFASTSCDKDDDKVDCDAIENQMDDLDEKIEDAFDDGDCDEVEDLLNQYLALYKKAKNCEFVIDEADDAGYDEDEIDEFLEELEALVDENVDYCNSVN